jgi:hypothetical protein
MDNNQPEVEEIQLYDLNAGFSIPSGSATAVKLVAPSKPIRQGFTLHRSISRSNPPLSWLQPLNRSVKFQTFPNQPGDVTAVRPSRLPDETVRLRASRFNLAAQPRLSLLRPLTEP